MAMTIELSESQMPRPLPVPTFSAPFAAPSLRWACKKRLRCFNPDAAAALRLAYSPDFGRPPARQFDLARLPQLAAAAAAAHSRSPSLPPRSPPSTKSPIRIPASRREEDVREEPPDLSSGAREAGELGSGGEAVGWCLRSRTRCGDGTGSEKKTTKRRKVELWVSLSRDEIEGDFLSMTGSKPPRRHRRGGSKAVSNHLLKGIFPGSCLPTFITADRYKVPENSDPRKLELIR
ncbi:hypothetical protein Taro_035593 [Colocasia esculenta]|uniref:Uncharacterized protein n=1 Tax=Colocasia esculenta TaxID=4460 RepID=A0A843VZC2_COLES|nr:hypothetical protein [Colocasia esculenta]